MCDCIFLALSLKRTHSHSSRASIFCVNQARVRRSITLVCMYVRVRLHRVAFMVSVNHCFSLFSSFLGFPGELENAAAAALLQQQLAAAGSSTGGGTDGKEGTGETFATRAEHMKKDGQFSH